MWEIYPFIEFHRPNFFSELSYCAMNVHRESGKETFDYKKQFNIQTQLIYSLRARIEELETDSLIKDQSINKLQREIFDLKKSIQTIYDNINTLSGNLFVPGELQPLAQSSAQKYASISEELEIRKLNNLMEEYFSILNVEEAIISFKEFKSEHHAKAIELFANKAIESNQKDVDDVMNLFKNIASSKICNNNTFKNGFEGTISFLMDIGVDKPLAYSFTGQLLFSAELDFQDITKLLKPLDDDKLIGKIIKGYANALKNNVDEPTYIQKLNEFNFKSLFSMANEDDLNKFLQNLGLGSFFSHGRNDNRSRNYNYDRNEYKNINYNYNNKSNESENRSHNYVNKDVNKGYSYSSYIYNRNPYPDPYNGSENRDNLNPTSYVKEGAYNENPYPNAYNEDKDKDLYGENPYPDPYSEHESKDLYSGISYSGGNETYGNPENKSKDPYTDSYNKNRPYGGNPFPESFSGNENKDNYGGNPFPESYSGNESKDNYGGNPFPESYSENESKDLYGGNDLYNEKESKDLYNSSYTIPYDRDGNKDSYNNRNLYSNPYIENESKGPYGKNPYPDSHSKNDKNSYSNPYNENKNRINYDGSNSLYKDERKESYNKNSYSDLYSKNDDKNFYGGNYKNGSENVNKNYSNSYDEVRSKDSHDGNSYNKNLNNNKNPYPDSYGENRSYSENYNKNYNDDFYNNEDKTYNENSKYNKNINNYNNFYDENRSHNSSENSYSRNKNNYTYNENKSKNPYNRNNYNEYNNRNFNTTNNNRTYDDTW
ncbi:unnamed protein product [Rhizophagus irregularis]|nr:unnamed protein product [Rhizophagus irregularis]CAB4417043.1 unnamed protein product [Rhizophagus irregularis]